MLIMAVKVNGAQRSYPLGLDLYCHDQHATPFQHNKVTLNSEERCLIFIDMFRMITSYLKSLEEPNLIHRLKKIVVKLLPTGSVTIDEVASELFMSKRTLQRHLEKSGTSFLKLFKEVRLELTMQYISDPAMDLTETAYLLGFTKQSSFSRSFKRWKGMSPIKFRKTYLVD